MTEYLRMYLIVLLSFVIIDLFWLGIVAKKLYRKYIGFLMRDKVYWPAAIIFYLLFIGGILFFAVLPGIERSSILYGTLSGGFFGFISYATYDLTNLATLKGWPKTITVIDLTWGTLLTGGTSALSLWMIQLLA